MAKANRSLGDKVQNGNSANMQTEEVIETAVHTAKPEEAQRSTGKKQEIELRYGQCIVAPVNCQDDEIVTTIDDWHSLYNAGANAGRFVLKAEKKSS